MHCCIASLRFGFRHIWGTSVRASSCLPWQQHAVLLVRASSEETEKVRNALHFPLKVSLDTSTSKYFEVLLNTWRYFKPTYTFEEMEKVRNTLHFPLKVSLDTSTYFGLLLSTLSYFLVSPDTWRYFKTTYKWCINTSEMHNTLHFSLKVSLDTFEKTQCWKVMLFGDTF